MKRLSVFRNQNNLGKNRLKTYLNLIKTLVSITVSMTSFVIKGAESAVKMKNFPPPDRSERNALFLNTFLKEMKGKKRPLYA